MFRTKHLFHYPENNRMKKRNKQMRMIALCWTETRERLGVLFNNDLDWVVIRGTPAHYC